MDIYWFDKYMEEQEVEKLFDCHDELSKYPYPHPALCGTAPAQSAGKYGHERIAIARILGQESHPGTGSRICNALELFREPVLDV